jgi:hypothetical protein
LPPFLFHFALQRSVCAFQFFFLSFSSRFQLEGVSFCVGQECRSQLLLRRIFFGLCASPPGRGKEFRSWMMNCAHSSRHRSSLG